MTTVDFVRDMSSPPFHASMRLRAPTAPIERHGSKIDAALFDGIVLFIGQSP
jgi:hypothetical protein